MTSRSEERAPLSPAAAAFAQFLARRTQGDAQSFEAFCASQSELAPALWALHASWRALDRELDLDRRASLSARIEACFGAGGDPGISLDETVELDAATGAERAYVFSGERRYQLVGEVARGGMGAILSVFDRDLRRTLAMKVLLAGTAAEPRALARFLEEAQVTSQLEHPGIVPVHELGLDSFGRVYFTMRLVRGRHLGDVFALARAEHEGWSRTRVLGVLVRVCEALAFAHQKGVVHRDLKPQNVMVGRFGETYVMDWGLARVRGRGVEPARASEGISQILTRRSTAAGESGDSTLATQSGAVIGTPVYMPPEQAMGRVEDVDERSDVYSLGVMLYELLSGTRPYLAPGERPARQVVIARVVAGPPAPLRGAPPELTAICEKAMARDQRARYASASELGEDLRAYLELRVVRAHRTGALAELAKWVRRNRGLALALAALVLALAVGLAASLALWLAAERERTKVLQLADLQRLRELEQRALELFPERPELLGAYAAWLDEARALLLRLDAVHRPTLSALWSASASSPEERWQRAALERLVAELEAFAEPEVGLVAEVAARRVFASEVEERTVAGADVAARWRDAIASIADARECPAYAGLALAPQVGLVPLGRDPRSGLWEFGHLRSGEPPERDPQTGELVFEEQSSLVFVLLPGGVVRMGAQRADQNAANYDVLALVDEAPVNDVALDPFFLSKYELTQAQWLRLTGSNPSGNRRDSAPELVFDLRHPVERVSWLACARLVARLGLALPFEAQWEYAARAGTPTPWWTGATEETLAGAANFADLSAARAGASWPELAGAKLDDGFVVHAPVGSLRPNPFGLHDVHGNVWEWCAEHYGTYAVAAEPGSGSRPAGRLGEDVVNRGGGFYDDARHVRSAVRMHQPPEPAYDDVGLRPARRVE